MYCNNYSVYLDLLLYQRGFLGTTCRRRQPSSRDRNQSPVCPEISALESSDRKTCDTRVALPVVALRGGTVGPQCRTYHRERVNSRQTCSRIARLGWETGSLGFKAGSIEHPAPDMKRRWSLYFAILFMG